MAFASVDGSVCSGVDVNPRLSGSGRFKRSRGFFSNGEHYAPVMVKASDGQHNMTVGMAEYGSQCQVDDEEGADNGKMGGYLHRYGWQTEVATAVAERLGLWRCGGRQIGLSMQLPGYKAC